MIFYLLKLDYLLLLENYFKENLIIFAVHFSLLWYAFIYVFACFRYFIMFKSINIFFIQVYDLFQSLCCVDKKGLLSWSNPSAEKVFFYSHSGKESMKLEEFDRNSVSGCGDIPDTLQIQDHSRMDETKRKKLRKFQSMNLYFKTHA